MTRSYLFLMPVLLVALTGCLDTRQAQKEQEEKQVLRKQITNVQQNAADLNARFQEIEDDRRKLSGRIEASDHKIDNVSKHLDRVAAAADARIKQRDDFYREELVKLNNVVTELKTQVETLQAAQTAQAAQLAALEEARRAQAAESQRAAETANKNPFAAAETKFKNQQWREAILDYERYRKANPKGKQFSTATYKIGVCFQELGSPEDAKAFYEEVISRFPGTKDADRAKTRLNGLAKKNKKAS